MRIGELASQTGFAESQIRYYERRGLLPAPPRSDTGYRVYSEADVARLRLFRQLKLHGLALADAARVLTVAVRGCCGETEPTVHALMQRRIAEIDAQITELQSLRARLAETPLARATPSPDGCGSAVCLPNDNGEATPSAATGPARVLPIVDGR